MRVPIDRQANPGIDPYLIPLSLADQYRVKVDTFIDGLQDEKDTEPSCGSVQFSTVGSLQLKYPRLFDE